MTVAPPPGVTLAPPLYRHPLGLPAGSVRSTLVLMIVGLFWLYLLLPASTHPNLEVPLYLYMLLALVLVFFASHGKSIAGAGAAHPSPWWLPRGFFRGFILLGTVGIIAWKAYDDPDLLTQRLHLDERLHLEFWPWLLAALGGGYALGWLLHLGPWRNYPWFQDIQAWISLLAMLGLTILAIVHLLISPDLEQKLNMTTLEWIVTAIAAFYFGIRS